MPHDRQEGARLLVRCAALVGGLAALCGAGASVLSALDVINVDWDDKALICAIAAMLCGGFVVVCGLAWRLYRGAMVALCFGYLLVGFTLAWPLALVLATGFGAAGSERQLAAMAIIALLSMVAGIALHRQIDILKHSPKTK